MDGPTFEAFQTGELCAQFSFCCCCSLGAIALEVNTLPSLPAHQALAKNAMAIQFPVCFFLLSLSLFEHQARLGPFSVPPAKCLGSQFDVEKRKLFEATEKSHQLDYTQKREEGEIQKKREPIRPLLD